MGWNTYRDGGKECRKCGIVKPLFSFHQHKRDGLQSRCKNCQYGINRNNPKLGECARNWALRNKEKRRASDAKYRKTDKAKARSYKEWLKRAYGVTSETITESLARQNNRCAVCGERFAKRPQIDHDHKTGAIRGLLCGPCNRGIGMFRDNAEFLENAATYIKAASSSAPSAPSSPSKA